MQIGVVGLNHKLADLKLRERIAKTCQRRFGSSCSVHIDHDFVLLSTCNRTEIYFFSQDLPKTHKYILSILRADIEEEFDQKFYSFFNEDCFQHLARVTSGLDSAIIFETEIQGQVKLAYEEACRFSNLSFNLHFLFQKCLRIAKKVRAVIPSERGIPDIEHAILNTGKHFFNNVESQRVLFVGVSTINLKILHFLRKKNIADITLCNRTDKRAKEFADRYQINYQPWKNLQQWTEFDWVIFGTKSPEHLISTKGLSTPIHSQKLIIDLSVPRNVAPCIGRNSQITLLNIDQLNCILKHRKKKVYSLVSHAEWVVGDSSIRQFKTFRKKEGFRAELSRSTLVNS